MFGPIGEYWNNLIVGALGLVNTSFVSLGLDFPFLSSWALTIIFFTLVIKLVTLPLTFKQLHSARATARLQPELKALQKQYGKDRAAMAQAQQELYKANGVNPLSGCLPSLIQMPVWIGLYSALFHLAGNPALYPDFASSHFFWINNLGLTELHNLTGIDGAGAQYIFHWPPYIPVLALLTGVTGWVTQKMMTMPNTDPSQAQMQSMMQFMPLMFVFFSLSVPAGLVLYWVANNVFTMASQWVLQMWGGLDNHPPVIPATALAALANDKATAGKGGGTPRNRAPAVVRGDSPTRVDGAEKEPVHNALPQAAPGARKRRRRSK